jgi:amphi-Trp domain-containing protein
MADQTTNTESLDRETAAERLDAIADALRDGEEFTVSVGNKDISLSPPETIDYRIDVIEKRARFRGSRETVKIELDWKPE